MLANSLCTLVFCIAYSIVCEMKYFLTQNAFLPPFTVWFLYDIQHQYIDDLNSRFMCILLVIFVIYNYSIDIQMLYDIHVIKSYVQCFNHMYY